MTKQDTKPVQDEQTNQEQNQNSSLEEKLTQIQEEKHNSETKDKDQEILHLQEKIALLEKEKQEVMEIAKKAQFEYMNLKVDFDRVQRLSAEKEKSMEVDSLIKYMKKILPVVEQLRTSLDHVDESKKEDPFVLGVKMVFDNMMKTLEQLGIKPIESLGLAPDGLLHEPLSTMPVEDTAMKGKIVQVFQQGYYLEKDGQKTVVLTSKVVVGA
ncbi:TPA: nucleotide exchange factor GrpE [Patescibacteria group bacterium]|nr:nucleotide exchange factor GrpE [Candidatus Gracilibacteria bacterium]